MNKDKIAMVMLLAKKMNVTEETVVGCAIIYNSGKWRQTLYRDDLTYEYRDYQEGSVSRIVEDFCIDYLSGRIPPNLLMNVLIRLGGQTETKPLKKKKG